MATEALGSAVQSVVAADARPLVMHIVYHFDIGGLENGIVNLLNHMPVHAYRHAVVSLTDVTGFSQRVRRDDIEFIALHKRPGHGLWLYPRLYALMRERRPAIVHTRNLAALEAVVPAWLARVPVRLHGEHGRDMNDLDGGSRKYQWVRRAYRPFVSHYFALSRDLAGYLIGKIGVAHRRVTQVYNGVDIDVFTPAGVQPAAIAGCPFDPARHWLVGTVGRMQAVKDQPTLVRAFLRALQQQPALRERMRLVIVGEGPLRAQCLLMLGQAGAAELAWLPGERDDVADVMRGLNCFVLPSLAEGISNTILEAMASGLPIIATAVGGNADLVTHGKTGEVVAPGDVEAMAGAVARFAGAPQQAAAMGRAGRAKVKAQFSLQAMVQSYRRAYDRHLATMRNSQGVA
jgi:sugar transferase (PEP-CTERM/EpsH1 system associated)